MAFFFWCLALVALAVLPGAALLSALPQDARARLSRWWIMLAPAAGLSVSTACAYVGVLIQNRLSWQAAVPAAALAVAGIAALAGRRLPLGGALSLFVPTVIGVVTLVAFPFRRHFAPPDVDPQLFGLLAEMLKYSAHGEVGFPLTRLWRPWPAEHLFAATAGSETLVAGFSLLTDASLGPSLVIVAAAWVSAAVLAAAVTVRELLGERSPWLVLAALPLAFNATVTWEYGDGAYARAAAAAPTAAVVSLLALGPSVLSWRGLAVAGALHGTTLYLLYRVFLWNTFAIAIWLLVIAWQRRRVPVTAKMLLSLPGAAGIVVLPVVVAVWARLGYYQATHAAGMPLFAEKHQLSFQRLYAYGEFVHGYAAPVLAIAGLSAAAVVTSHPALNRLLSRDAVTVGLAFTAAMLFFSTDWLVTTVFPFTANLLYSQMAFIANWTVTKLIGGVCALGLAWTLIGRLPAWGRLAFLVLPALALVWLRDGVWAAGHKIWPEFVRLLPDNNGVEHAYALMFWWLAAVLVAIAAVLVKRTSFATASILACGAVLMSAEMRVGRFNYDFVTPDEAEAYHWIKENTSRTETLVLTASVQDLDQSVRASNASNYFPDASLPMYYQLAWLPVLAERAAVFQRGTLVLGYSGVFMPVSGRPLDLTELDWSFWHLQTPAAEARLRANAITHVYVPAIFARIMKSDLDQVRYLKLVHESPPHAFFKVPNLVYEVTGARDR